MSPTLKRQAIGTSVELWATTQEAMHTARKVNAPWLHGIPAWSASSPYPTRTQALAWPFFMERVTRIELALSAREARVS